MIETDERPVWSKSQVSTLKECDRKFLFSTGNGPEETASLKKIKNRHLWVGGLLHEEIGHILKTVRQNSPLPSEEEVISKVKERMRAELQDSKRNASTQMRLFEHEYGVAIDATTWRNHWETVEKSLRWFLGSKWFHRLSLLGPECWKAVDEILSFDVVGIKSYVKIDCAVERDGKFFLIDWKTSAASGRKDGDALQVAALYAHEVWGADPESIEAHLISLLDGRSSKITLSEESLMETHLRIEEEASLLAEKRAALGNDPFLVPLPSNLSTCVRCNFQRLCHPASVYAA